MLLERDYAAYLLAYLAESGYYGRDLKTAIS